jgi:hypothetical protein
MTKTRPSEFSKFHNALMSNAPKDYTPWYFPVVAGNKAPDGLAIAARAPANVKENRGSWKAPWARLTFEEALERLKQGGNVGLAARENDPLCIIDIDNFELSHLMPDTLIVSSRKKVGFHGFCWWSEA